MSPPVFLLKDVDWVQHGMVYTRDGYRDLLPALNWRLSAARSQHLLIMQNSGHAAGVIGMEVHS